ncbi:uncharacterized protein LOC126700237 [Quercus robur]|uniref:uncharacterized protein LOC126700237 n=1 Tax=Quercus robur TaxID=38942 RepID=UPI002163CA79|nr:uncharacterized protein LOC126700237 [Quercus robur]
MLTTSGVQKGRDKHSLNSEKASLMTMAGSLRGGAKMKIRIAAIGKEFSAVTKLVMYSSFILVVPKMMECNLFEGWLHSGAESETLNPREVRCCYWVLTSK